MFLDMEAIVMRRLLVPFDGSENAKRAVQHAIDMATSSPSIELHIVRAFEPPTMRDDDSSILDAKAHQERYLNSAIEMVRAAGVRFTGEILVGSAAKAVVDYANRVGCEAIVMGTRGMGAVGNLLLGSIATKVLHLAKVPVTLVK
jgi:nucleotide-binding universal stress UspA family protein